MNIDKAIQLAIEHQKAGNLQQAEHICKKILKKQPNNLDVLHFLGVICHQLQNYDSAILYMKKVLKFKPNLPDLNHNLGLAFQKKGKIDEAITCYQKALYLNPDYDKAYFNMGNALREKTQWNEAIVCYQKALQSNPNLVEAYNSLGFALYTLGKFSEAIENFRYALSLNPDYFEAYLNLGNAYIYQGYFNKTEECYRQALIIKPDCSLCYSNLLFSMNYRYDAQTIFSEHLRFAKQHAQLLSSDIFPHSNERLFNRPLRIGYVSPDFKRHPVACFIEPVLMAHNHEQFEIFCYSDVPSHDEVTRRLKSYANQWRSIVGMSDENVAELIRNDVIDILIDLAGHTAGNRILVFARKPAPIQISWIGYLATTGLSTMDYRIADMYTDPPGMTEQFYTEELIRLPESFLCYLPDRDSPDVGPLPALSTGHITFGSFNNFAKVTHEVFSLWAQILKAIPKSRLIMKTFSFSDITTRQYTMDMFIQRGIEAERITLLLIDPSPKHLESYNLVDVGLDTFPFNGAATTCEALWMGVPVITLAGAAYHSRAGISLLSNAGLPELVAKTSDEYISIAVNLAKDLKRLQSLREHLRDMMTYSPLCDAKRFAANLEMCYCKMWETWCKSV